MTRGVGKCRDCGASLRFVRMENTGKLVPVDPTPDDGGNVYAHPAGDALHGHVKTKGEQLPPAWAVYMPHHATCRDSRRRAGRSARAPMTLLDRLPTEER